MAEYETVPLSPEEVKALMAEQQGYTSQPLTPEEIAALKAEAPPSPPKGVDPGRWKAFWRNALAGFFKQGSDEAAGLITMGAVDTSMPGAAWRDASGTPRLLHTPQDVYRAGRDAERRDLQAAQENRPGWSMAGSMAGDIASDAVLKQLGVPVTSSAYQTGMGALTGLLGSNAELTGEKRTPESEARAAQDTVLGGALGYVAPKVGTAIGKAAPVLLRKARSGLESAAIGMGRRVLQGGSDLAGARFKEVPADAILEAIRSGGILPFGTTQGAFKRLEELAKNRGAGYAGLLQDLQDLGFSGPEVQPLVDSLMSRADEMARTTITSGAPAGVLRKAGQKLENIARGGTGGERVMGAASETIPLDVAEAMKRTAQGEAKYGLLSDTPVNEAKQEVAAKVRKAIEDAIETQGAQFPEGSVERMQAEAFKPAKEQLSRTLAARNLAEKGNTRISGRNVVPLRESILGAMLAGGATAAGADPLTSLMQGAGTAAALTAAGRRLPSTGASAAYGLSRLAGGLANRPEALQTAGARAAASMGRGQNQLQALADYLLEDRKKKGAKR